MRIQICILLVCLLSGCKSLDTCLTFENVADSGSMVPMILPKSGIVLDHCYRFEDLRKGMVVVYKIENKRILHRIKYQLENGNWIARGDANDFDDSIKVTPDNFESVLVSWGRACK